jgi:acyl-CoA thioesterase YciA
LHADHLKVLETSRKEHARHLQTFGGLADTAASTVDLCYSSRRMNNVDQPKGELVIQTIAMPKDTNPNGDIFGGWLTSQMDLGSGILAAKVAQARVVTVAMEGMSFLEPVRVGDTVACYAWVERIGRTSMVIPVEVWVRRYMHSKQLRVTRGVFTHVAVDDSGRPIPVKRDAS